MKKFDNFYIIPNNSFVDLNLYQCGWEQCASGHSFGPATRNHFLFHYVIKGAGTLWAEDAKGKNNIFEIKEGHGFLIYPGQITTYIADSKNPWEYSWIEFDGLKVNEILSFTTLSKEMPIFDAGSKELSKEIIDKLFFITHNSEESMFTLIGYLYEVLGLIVKGASNGKKLGASKMSDFYVRETVSYIEHNFEKEISVEDMANNCGIDRSYLSKVFKSTIGSSPQEFLIKYRMSRASELLCSTELSVSEISRRVGYENSLHFSRAFKNFFGISPRDYRKTH